MYKDTMNYGAYRIFARPKVTEVSVFVSKFPMLLSLIELKPYCGHFIPIEHQCVRVRVCNARKVYPLQCLNNLH